MARARGSRSIPTCWAVSITGGLSDPLLAISISKVNASTEIEVVMSRWTLPSSGPPIVKLIQVFIYIVFVFQIIPNASHLFFPFFLFPIHLPYIPYFRSAALRLIMLWPAQQSGESTEEVNHQSGQGITAYHRASQGITWYVNQPEPSATQGSEPESERTHESREKRDKKSKVPRQGDSSNIP